MAAVEVAGDGEARGAEVEDEEEAVEASTRGFNST